MSSQLLTQGRGGADLLFLERRHFRRRRRRWGVEQILQDPLAADDRRSTSCVRRDGQGARLRDDPAPVRVRRKLNLAELVPLDPANTVELRQPLVQESVARVDEFE